MKTWDCEYTANPVPIHDLEADAYSQTEKERDAQISLKIYFHIKKTL